MLLWYLRPVTLARENIVDDRKGIVIGCATGTLAFACLCCLVFVGFTAFVARRAILNSPSSGVFTVSGTPTVTPQVIRPTETASQPQSQGGDGDSALPSSLSPAHQTLQSLEDTVVPVNDPRSLAQRLLGVEDIPLTVPPPAAPLQVGAREQFWLTDTSTNRTFQVEAVLRYITDHLYFWIEDGVRYDQEELRAIAEEFERKIYPTNRAFFGTEWSPGVDGDPHLYVVYARGIGFSTAGYFSSADELHPLAHEYSNAHEMFIVNADNSPLGDEYTYGILAHEFQHMIHWYLDRNETSWLNEGFSELATLLNGYTPGGFDFLYTTNPDRQLNDWPNDQNDTGPHYGAGFLFVTYFLDRLGETATQALAAHTDNGLKSIDVVLQDLALTDALSNQPMTADNLVLDWGLANYLHDGSLADGRYTYDNYPDAPTASPTETITQCEPGVQTRTVHQYGFDYIRITCGGQLSLRFEGSVETTLLPASAYSGEYAVWSNKGDESDMTLTRTFDFTGLSAPLTLTYWTWYDIEADYDYVYLEASTDGERWEILTTPSGTAEDPSGNSYGWGYNDLSDGTGTWVQEQVDLSPYAGRQLQLRFEYVTDAAVNGEGMLIDDVAIPETGYFEDFETGDGGWQAGGWVRVQNTLPQTFRLALVTEGAVTEVEYLALDATNSLTIPLDIGGEVDEVVLVVMGTTRFTRQPAAYRFDFLP